MLLNSNLSEGDRIGSIWTINTLQGFIFPVESLNPSFDRMSRPIPLDKTQ